MKCLPKSDGEWPFQKWALPKGGSKSVTGTTIVYGGRNSKWVTNPLIIKSKKRSYKKRRKKHKKILKSDPTQRKNAPA